MSSSLVELSDLRKVYPARRGQGHQDLVAADCVTFSIEEGSSVALVGTSGSGKTTVARIIAGLESATSGRVVVCGEDWTGSKRIGAARRRRRAGRVQMVFQDPYQSLDRRQTVGDGLHELLQVHGAIEGAAIPGRVSALLEQVGLSPAVAGSYPRALSGGERQRVAISRALAPEPSLLVLDEAVAALDVSIQAQILNLLADIQERTGMAYLFISHDLAVVNQISDETLVMHEGKIIERGPTRAILEEPEQAYTKLLLESVPRPGWHPTRRTRIETLDRYPGDSGE